MRAIQRKAIDAYLDGVAVRKLAPEVVDLLLLAVNDPELRRWLIEVRIRERISERRAATAELFTTDSAVADTVLDVLWYEQHHNRARVILAIDGDLADTLDCYMPLERLAIRRAA